MRWADERETTGPSWKACAGGGLLYEPNDAATVARTLEILLTDPARARALGGAGREAVLREYTVERMAERAEAVYARVCTAPGRHFHSQGHLDVCLDGAASDVARNQRAEVDDVGSTR